MSKTRGAQYQFGRAEFHKRRVRPQYFGVRENHNVLAIARREVGLVPNSRTQHVACGEAVVRKNVGPPARPSLIDVIDAALIWEGRREENGWSEACQVFNEAFGARGGQMLGHLQRNREVELTLQSEGLLDIRWPELRNRNL